MSGLELAALGALGASYLDARFGIVRDIITLKRFIACNLYWALTERSGDVSAYSVFDNFVRKTPDKPFLVYLEPVVVGSETPDAPLEDKFVYRQYTYAETEVLVQTYATYLKETQGIKFGDVVALDFVNKPELVIVWFALWSLGAVPALINYRLEGAGLGHCLKVSNSKLFIVDEDVGAPEADINTVNATKQHFEHVFHSYTQTRYQKRRLKGSDSALYIFTSGTTGLPKAANMSWKKANWGAKLYASVSDYNANQVLFSCMPLYHSTAAILGLVSTLHAGGTYAIGHKFSTTTFWTQARLSGANAIQYVGETGRYLVNAPEGKDDRNHNVRVAFGNGMRPDIWQKFKDRFGITTLSEFYGATEFPSAINNNQNGSFGVGACAHYGSLITAISKQIRFKIAKVDPETQDLYRDPITGFAKETEVNEPGEFLFVIKANNVSADFQGYAGNKAASDEKLVFDLFKKGDAYVRTGDLLKIDADNCIYFVDRLGDTFRWKSENVSTNEVEEAFSGVNNIDMVVCVGVKVPQHEGRAGFAVVKLKDPAKPLDMKLLATHLQKRLPSYAVPVFVKIVDTISLTGNNKVQKKLFRQQRIPAPPGEKIYWLSGGVYEELTPQSWARVEHGSHKL